MLIAKLHDARGKQLLAVCDKELLGKVFCEGKRQLDLSSSFYKGHELSENEFEQAVTGCDIINMVGPRVIAIARALGLVEDEHIINVGGIPHAQVITLNPIS